MDKKKIRLKIEKLRQILDGKSQMLIVLQDNPDPDSIASSMALRQLSNHLAKVPCSITYGGTVGRGENRALVRYLGVNLRPYKTINPAQFDVIALVDTQPDTGNNSLAADVVPDIVVDHHPFRRATARAKLIDIRSSYGATSTILLEYLIVADITPEAPLATAMLYGIRSDTQDLGMQAKKADIDAIYVLFPLANKRMLSEIQQGKVQREYYQMLATAITKAKVCDYAIIAGLGEIDNPDMIAELADLFLRDDGTQWTLCYGIYEGKLLFSLRCSQDGGRADEIAHRIAARRGTGGGHASRAGGQIPLKQTDKKQLARLENQIQRKFLKILGITPNKCQKLTP